jgi:hypothetical protein
MGRRLDAELLAMLSRRYETARLLVLGTVRDAKSPRLIRLHGVMGELEAHSRATVLRLEGLPESAVVEYLGAPLRGTRFPARARKSHLRADRVEIPSLSSVSSAISSAVKC